MELHGRRVKVSGPTLVGPPTLLYFTQIVPRQQQPALAIETEDGGRIRLYGTIDRVDTYEKDGATYVRVVDYKTGKKDSEIYKRANISKQHFSKIINDPNAKPSKQTVIALALALELDLDGTKDLIGRAGYALTNSNTFDLIIRYFIEHKQYNVIEINIALYEFDQSLLGS